MGRYPPSVGRVGTRAGSGKGRDFPGVGDPCHCLAIRKVVSVVLCGERTP